MNADLLKILVCPETHQPVTMASESVVAALNQKIEEGTLRNEAGEVVEESMEGALIREDGTVAYPIRHDIPIMLVEERLTL